MGTGLGKCFLALLLLQLDLVHFLFLTDEVLLPVITNGLLVLDAVVANHKSLVLFIDPQLLTYQLALLLFALPDFPHLRLSCLHLS